MSTEFCVVKTIRNTRSIEGAISCFNVNRNFMLSDFVSTEFYCTYIMVRPLIVDSPNEDTV